MKKLKSLLRLVFGRTALVILFLLIQIGILLVGFRVLYEYLAFIYGGFVLVSAAVVVYILNKREDPGYQMVWMILILVVPVFGVLFYIYMELELGSRILRKRTLTVMKETQAYLKPYQMIHQIAECDEKEYRLVSYLHQNGGFPAYKNTAVTYFPLGEAKFAQLKEELEKAEHFIFMEYFIIDFGVMWNELLAILERKASQGVEVRVMYDGMCSLILLPYDYPKELQKKGIRSKMFSPIKPALSSYQNNRDHRKITVIDGHTAFTGGVNLADEYINQKECFGHWKDTALMLKGDAVNSFTMMFLQMWNAQDWSPEQYSDYLLPANTVHLDNADQGFVIPYGDSPLDGEAVGEHVYMDILYQAKRYVHIMTPYLILDHTMLTALTHTARCGIEVIIIMPHIPDKQSAYLSARSYYLELIQAGVQIYEYQPGFVHAKSFVSDDQRAVVGTINLDYRSLHLHFECAAYLYKNEAVYDIEKDFQETLAKCIPVTEESCRQYPLYKRAIGRVLRILAPLM